MDLATIVGLIAAFGLVLTAILTGGSLMIFVDIPSLFIVVGGTIGATLVTYPLGDIIGIIGVTKNAFFADKQDLLNIINKIVEYAKTARKDGVLALENFIEKEQNKFLEKGIRLVIDGTEPDVIKEVLEIDLGYIGERHKTGIGIFEAMGNYSPAFGMIGTLIGLVLMLQAMDDPSSIGPAMSVALITTFYGALFANIVFLPIAGKLKKRSGDELLEKEIILAGVLAIQVGDNPRLIEQKLHAYIPPKLRISTFSK